MDTYVRRPLEDLDLLDDFLMGAVASDEEVGPTVCRKILSTILNREIGEVRITAQRTILAATPELRGIRMDVEVLESTEAAGKGLPAMNIYDIEPHIPKDRYLPRRSRFYQAKVDGKHLASGEKDFSRLPNLYVITITPYDPFGYDYMMYTVENTCREVPDLPYDDGLQYLYLNSEGQKGGTKAIREMLQYFADSREENAASDDLREIHRCIGRVKVQPEVKKNYMKFEEIIYYARKEAAEEAIKEAEEKIEEAEKRAEKAEGNAKRAEENAKRAEENAKKAEGNAKKAEENARKADIRRRREDIFDLLEEYGSVPEKLEKHISKEEDVETLRSWHKLAAKVTSIEEFEARI